MEDEDGKGRAVSGQYLGALLHDERTLRLAILNACEGARSSRSDPFAGVAQSLVKQGVPAVIAMQFEITDEAAITLASEFYSALADGYPVDGALAEARKAIDMALGETLDFSDDAFDAAISALCMAEDANSFRRLPRARNKQERIEGRVWLPS